MAYIKLVGLSAIKTEKHLYEELHINGKKNTTRCLLLAIVVDCFVG